MEEYIESENKNISAKSNPKLKSSQAYTLSVVSLLAIIPFFFLKIALFQIYFSIIAVICCIGFLIYGMKLESAENKNTNENTIEPLVITPEEEHYYDLTGSHSYYREDFLQLIKNYEKDYGKISACILTTDKYTYRYFDVVFVEDVKQNKESVMKRLLQFDTVTENLAKKMIECGAVAEDTDSTQAYFLENEYNKAGIRVKAVKHYVAPVEDFFMVFESSETLLINAKPYKFKDIIKFDATDNTTTIFSGQVSKTKTDTWDMISRAAVGRSFFGDAGAVIGGSTANTTTYTSPSVARQMHDYKIFITVNDLTNPLIQLYLKDKEDVARKISSILSVIINRNNA